LGEREWFLGGRPKREAWEKERSGWVKKNNKKKGKAVVGAFTIIKKKIKWSWLNASHVVLLYPFS
jgi:hypothetical protein